MKAYMEPQVTVITIEQDVITASTCPHHFELPITGEGDIEE